MLLNYILPHIPFGHPMINNIRTVHGAIISEYNTYKDVLQMKGWLWLLCMLFIQAKNQQKTSPTKKRGLYTLYRASEKVLLCRPHNIIHFIFLFWGTESLICIRILNTFKKR